MEPGSRQLPGHPRLGGSLVIRSHPTSNNEPIAIKAVLMVGAVCLLWYTSRPVGKFTWSAARFFAT